MRFTGGLEDTVDRDHQRLGTCRRGGGNCESHLHKPERVERKSRTLHDDRGSAYADGQGQERGVAIRQCSAGGDVAGEDLVENLTRAREKECGNHAARHQGRGQQIAAGVGEDTRGGRGDGEWKRRHLPVIIDAQHRLAGAGFVGNLDVDLRG